MHTLYHPSRIRHIGLYRNVKRGRALHGVGPSAAGASGYAAAGITNISGVSEQWPRNNFVYILTERTRGQQGCHWENVVQAHLASFPADQTPRKVFWPAPYQHIRAAANHEPSALLYQVPAKIRDPLAPLQPPQANHDQGPGRQDV